MSVDRDDIGYIDRTSHREDAMSAGTIEVVELTDAEARDAARTALESSGFTWADLAEQARCRDFLSLRARLTWEAVRHVGDPDA
jgi:hypothetical protein